MSKYPGRIITDLAPAGYSVSFNGSSYLSVANNAALDLGTGDFTIEGWWYFNDTSNQSMVSKYSGGDGYVVQQHGSTLRLVLGVSGSNPVYTFAWTPVVGVWYHVAITRSGTSGRAFVNGTQVGTTVTLTTSNTAASVALTLGFTQTTSEYTRGNLSNFRFTKGTALYTANFNAPTQLFPVTNTQLLTCQSPSFVDNSTNAFSVAVGGGTPAVSTLTPFTAYVPYNPALGASTPGVWTVDEAMQAKATRQWNMYDPHFNRVSLLLRSGATDGSQNNTFLDSSSNNFTITRNGNTTQGSYSPFSQTGWSNFFNGSSSIQSVSGASTGLGSGNFCVELWYYKTSTASSGLFGNLAGNSELQWAIIIATTLRFQGWNTLFLVTTEPSLNQWHHVAVSRSGTVLSMFVDGIRVATATNSTNFSDTPDIRVGGPNGINNYTGYISNARVVKGSAVYDPNQLTITVPTTPLTNITNTTYLTSQSNRFVDNSTNNFAITVSGTPSVQAFSPFLPTVAYTPQTIGGSGYFDGTGDNITVADSTAFTLGSGDFTIECWVYSTLAAQRQFIAGQMASNGANSSASFTIEKTVGNKLLCGYYSSTLQYGATSSADIPANAWTHIAFVRDGNTLRQYINGVQDGTVSVTGVTANDSSNNLSVGRSGEYALVEYFGYVANFRLVKGTCLYTSGTTFTPPTSPLTAVTNTSLLANFTNAGITDATAKNVLETVGNAQASTSVKNTRLITTPPTSMYFDGSGDYLQVAPNSLFNLGSADFTIEFWIYPTSFAVATYPLYSQFNRSTTNAFAIEIRTTGRVDAYVTNAGGAAWSLINAGELGTVTLNTWNHVAFVRNGTAFRGYVNGVQGALSTNSSNTIETFNGFNIGAVGAGSSGYFTGYIDDYRISRYARYTAAFTPPRSRLQEQ